jgi:hypothetical protein
MRDYLKLYWPGCWSTPHHPSAVLSSAANSFGECVVDSTCSTHIIALSTANVSTILPPYSIYKNNYMHRQDSIPTTTMLHHAAAGKADNIEQQHQQPTPMVPFLLQSFSSGYQQLVRWPRGRTATHTPPPPLPPLLLLGTSPWLLIMMLPQPLEEPLWPPLSEGPAVAGCTTTPMSLVRCLTRPSALLAQSACKHPLRSVGSRSTSPCSKQQKNIKQRPSPAAKDVPELPSTTIPAGADRLPGP